MEATDITYELHLKIKKVDYFLTVIVDRRLKKSLRIAQGKD